MSLTRSLSSPAALAIARVRMPRVRFPLKHDISDQTWFDLITCENATPKTISRAGSERRATVQRRAYDRVRSGRPSEGRDGPTTDWDSE